MHSMTITSGDLTLWARRDGKSENPPILLIAGANASHLMWPDEFVNLLVEKGFSVIRYDHRDTGRSSKIDFQASPYSVETLANDAIAVLDGFGIAKAHVVGLSMGGTLAQVLLLDHPDRIISAVIMLTASLDVDFVGNLSRVYSGEAEPQGLPLPSRSILDQLSARAKPSNSESEELQKRVAEWMALSGNLAKIDAEEFHRWESLAIAHAGTYSQPSNHALAKPVDTQRGVELKRVSTPVLVIQGGQDPLNPPPHGKHLAEKIPGATLLEIAELGHSLPSSLHSKIVHHIANHCHAHAA